jgi:hypothetical protein
MGMVETKIGMIENKMKSMENKIGMIENKMESIERLLLQLVEKRGH